MGEASFFELAAPAHRLRCCPIKQPRELPHHPKLSRTCPSRKFFDRGLVAQPGIAQAICWGVGWQLADR
jgi:hypothetical protein